MNEIKSEFDDYAQQIIKKFQSTTSINELFLFFSSKEMANKLNSGYVSLFNKIGSEEDFSGAYFCFRKIQA